MWHCGQNNRIKINQVNRKEIMLAQGLHLTRWIQSILGVRKFNLIDFFTKYHPSATRRRFRPICYTYIPGKSLTSLQECVKKLLTSKHRSQVHTDSKRKINKPAITARQSNQNTSIATHKLFRPTFTTKTFTPTTSYLSS